MSLWNHFNECPKLESACRTIHRGLEWIPGERGRKQNRFVSDEPRPGFVKGYARPAKHLSQYVLSNPQYLSLRPHEQLYRAHEYPWDSSKVVCNTTRVGTGPWRIAAAADEDGMAFSSNFIAFWPNEMVSVPALTALLNSPVCNAFLDHTSSSELNSLDNIKSLPLPSIETLAVGGIIEELARDLIKLLASAQSGQAKELLLKIDAQILDAYRFPTVLERELLDRFQNVKRPVPFDFTGYYPAGFTANFRLREVISEEFKNSRAELLLDRIPVINDSEIHEMLNFLRGDLEDE